MTAYAIKPLCRGCTADAPAALASTISRRGLVIVPGPSQVRVFTPGFVKIKVKAGMRSGPLYIPRISHVNILPELFIDATDCL